MKHSELVLEKKIERLKKAIEDWKDAMEEMQEKLDDVKKENEQLRTMLWDASRLGFAGQRRLEFMLRESLERKAKQAS